MRRLWLLFAQTITIAFGLYLVVATVRPDWLQRIKPVRRIDTGPAPVLQAASSSKPTGASFRDAAGRAMPSVVNIFSSKARPKGQSAAKD